MNEKFNTPNILEKEKNSEGITIEKLLSELKQNKIHEFDGEYARFTFYEWKDKNFDTYVKINSISKPLIELARPTKQGYHLLDTSGLKNKIYTSNIDKFPEMGEEDNKEIIDFQADSKHIPLKNNGVGVIFCSYLPYNERSETISETERVLEDNGLLIWQGGTIEDLQKAYELGFRVRHCIQCDYSPHNKDEEDSQNFDIIFEKMKRN